MAEPYTPKTGAGTDGPAIRKLLEGHRQFLAFLEKRVESRAVAEDILQSAFVRGLERASEIRDEESVVAWFYRVLRNAVIDHYRQRDSEARALGSLQSEIARQERPGPDTADEICGCVSGLLTTLKPEYREALEIVDLQDGKLQDLAQRAGITSTNAAVRVHRAREALRRQVTRACGTCAEHGCFDCRCRERRDGSGDASAAG